MLKDCQVNVHERGIDLAALDQFNKLPNTYFTGSGKVLPT